MNWRLIQKMILSEKKFVELDWICGQDRKRSSLRTFFQNWIEFAAKTENDFCLRINLYNCFELQAKAEKKLSWIFLKIRMNLRFAAKTENDFV